MNNFNGGVYGDYEVAKSTRVLENRMNTYNVYKRRLFNSSGGIVSQYLAAFNFITIYFVGSNLLKKKIPGKLAHISSAVAGLGVAYLAFKCGSNFIGDTEDYNNLKMNKNSILQEIEQAYKHIQRHLVVLHFTYLKELRF